MINSLPKDFDWKFYLENNQDLLDAGLKTERDAINHYLTSGKKEKRKFKKNISDQEYVKMKYLLDNSPNNKNKKRIIFINHDESKTGSPILLKSIIDYEIDQSEFDIWVISLHKSDDEWVGYNKIYYEVIPGETDYEKSKYIEKTLKPNLIYANTAVSILFSKHFSCRKIISIHEFRSLYSRVEELKDLLKFDKVVVACEPSKKLLNEFNIKSEISPYYLDFSDLIKTDFETDEKNTIVGIGYSQLRKGIHRFIEIASMIPNKKFIWIGSTEEVSIIDNEIEISGYNYLLSDYKLNDKIEKVKIKKSIPKNVEFVGLMERESIMNSIKNSDCLLMLSSDDPFPLVVIESKILNKNVVNLKESGDSYKVCDERDLILDEYDKDQIVNYLKNLKKNEDKINYDLINYFKSNIEINRKFYVDLLKKDDLKNSYVVNQPSNKKNNRPKIIHFIANFATGGSSRLVVDLIEFLGDKFEQIVFTQYIPDPPAYVNLEIYECANLNELDPYVKFLEEIKPDFVHIHYWGDCDYKWYDLIFKSCELKNIPIIQNINTPIDPYVSNNIKYNVYVSEYVKETFGFNDGKSITILPGSNLNHFSSDEIKSDVSDCIGMVYRLEKDKLNEDSINVFIEVAKLRPQTKCLIVGDGILKDKFIEKVTKEKLNDNFEFTGYVSYEDLPNYYKRMSVFVAPVWKESFGQVSSFAMNMKIPVVGYNVGAIPSIIENDELVSPYNDYKKLANIIISLLDDPNKRIEIGNKNQLKSEKEYSVLKMINEYKNIYLKIYANIQ